MTGYTPSLIISPRTVIRKTRRLPLPGQVLVTQGQVVQADDVVARAERPGRLTIIHASARLGLEPSDLLGSLVIDAPGAEVQAGDLLAEVRGLFGLFSAECRSPVDGIVEYASDKSGHIGVRQPPIPVEAKAFVDGTVVERLGDEGVVISAAGALLQGIYGKGGERRGIIRMVDGPWKPSNATMAAGARA